MNSDAECFKPSSHRQHWQDKTVLSCLVGGMNWTGDKSRQSETETEHVYFLAVLSSLEMRCELSFVLSRRSFQFATRSMIWCRQWIANHDRQGAYTATWCENCIATASDSATTSECKKYRSTTFWARSGHRSSDVTSTFACRSVLGGELWRHVFGNWVRTCLQKRSHRIRDSTKLFSLIK